MEKFAPFEQKMTAAGMGDAAIRAFRRNYESLLRNESGLIPEDRITPATPATFALTMLLSTDHGDAYTFDDYQRAWADLR